MQNIEFWPRLLVNVKMSFSQREIEYNWHCLWKTHFIISKYADRSVIFYICWVFKNRGNCSSFKESGKKVLSRQELKQSLSAKEQISADFWRRISLDVDFLLFNDITNLWTVSVSVLVNSKELPAKVFFILMMLGWSKYFEIALRTGSL